MTINSHIITELAILLLCLASCTKQNREMMYSAQESKIASFVESQLKSNPETRVEYNGGSVRLVLSEGDGVELNARGKVSLHYAGYNFSNGSVSSSNLFATNNYDFALASRWSVTDSTVYDAITIDMTDKDIIDGLRSGLVGVKEGEECYILFTGRYAFGKEKNGTIPANSPLAYRIWVNTIEN